MRPSKGRGRGRLNSGGNSTQRREYAPRPVAQAEIPQPGMDPQQPMMAPAAYTQYYMAPYQHYYAPQPQSANVNHPSAQHSGGAPLYLQPVPMGYPPMYGYPPGNVVYQVMPPEYIVDEKGEEQNPEVVQQMWSPNPDYQDPNQIDTQIPPQEEFIPAPQVIPVTEEVIPIPEDMSQTGPTITIPHQSIPVRHHVLNPNVPTFAVVNAQPAEPIQPQLYAQVSPQQVAPMSVVPSNQQQEFVSPNSMSPVGNIVQSYSKVSQHVAIAANETTEQHQTFVQAAASVTVVNTSSTYGMIEAAPSAIQPAISSSSDSSNNTDQSVVASQPLPQRVREPSSEGLILTKQGSTTSLTKTVSSSSLTGVVENVPNQQFSENINNQNVQTLSNNVKYNNNEDVNKLGKTMTEKLNVTATTTKSDRFGGANNKPVAWNTSKKTTTSVSVSAIPAKESTIQSNKTATVQPNTAQNKLSPPPFTTSNVKFNTSPVPKPTAVNNIDSGSRYGGEKKHEMVQKPVENQVTEAKKVEQQNKEITANVSEKKQMPPPLSLAPPPPPVTEDTKQDPPKLSWASLFSSNTSSNKTPPSLPHSFESTKRPVAKVSPFEGTPSPVTPSGGISYSAASAQGLLGPQQNSALPQKSAVEKKPIADEYSLKLANFFQNYKIDNNSISIFPRGLINRSNYCYINAILQALVSCPPFYHLMRDMPKPPPANKVKSCTPIMDAM